MRSELSSPRNGSGARALDAALVGARGSPSQRALAQNSAALAAVQRAQLAARGEALGGAGSAFARAATVNDLDVHYGEDTMAPALDAGGRSSLSISRQGSLNRGAAGGARVSLDSQLRTQDAAALLSAQESDGSAAAGRMSDGGGGGGGGHATDDSVPASDGGGGSIFSHAQAEDVALRVAARGQQSSASDGGGATTDGGGGYISAGDGGGSTGYKTDGSRSGSQLASPRRDQQHVMKGRVSGDLTGSSDAGPEARPKISPLPSTSSGRSTRAETSDGVSAAATSATAASGAAGGGGGSAASKAAVDALRRGAVFVKYTRWGKPHTREVWLDTDAEGGARDAIWWCAHDAAAGKVPDKKRRIYIDEITRVENHDDVVKRKCVQRGSGLFLRLALSAKHSLTTAFFSFMFFSPLPSPVSHPPTPPRAETCFDIKSKEASMMTMGDTTATSLSSPPTVSSTSRRPATRRRKRTECGARRSPCWWPRPPRRQRRRARRNTTL